MVPAQVSPETQRPKSKYAGGCRGREMEACDPLGTGEILEELLPVSGGTERDSRARLPLGTVWFLLGQAGSPSTPSLPAAGLDRWPHPEPSAAGAWGQIMFPCLPSAPSQLRFELFLP